MAHSVAFSRGFQYAKAEYEKATTKFQQVKVLTRLSKEGNNPSKTLFDQGILSFVKTQKGLNK